MVRLILYILLTILYFGLIIAGMALGTNWFMMIFLVYGLVHFGAKTFELLEEKGY